MGYGVPSSNPGEGYWVLCQHRDRPSAPRNDEIYHMHVIGIDPAPTKRSAVYDGKSFAWWDALEVADRVAELAIQHRNVLVTWDAPLSIDPEGTSRFYSRQVDRTAGARVKEWVAAGRVEQGAIGISPAASCPHNYLSQATLALPVGNPKPPWTLLKVGDQPPRSGHHIAEVHPAVALGAWWDGKWPMPCYKLGGGRKAQAVRAGRLSIVQWLQRAHGFPQGAPDSFTDDHVDAWVAWRLGAGLLRGDVVTWGPRVGGNYLMPTIEPWTE